MALEWDDGYKNYTHEVSDGVMTYRTVGDDMTMEEVAEDFALTYDHGAGDENIPCVCQISNLATGRRVVFAFWANGDFEWQTDREYVSY